MSLWATTRKAALQQRRDRLGTALTLGTAPAFVLLYWLFFGAQAPHAPPIGLVEPASLALTTALQRSGADLRRFPSEKTARDAVARGDLPLFVADSAALDRHLASGQPARLRAEGDASHLAWGLANALLRDAALSLERQRRPHSPTVHVDAVALGRTAARTPFEAYVPGLMVFAVIMLVFSSSMAAAREADTGTLDRLRMTPLGAAPLLAGVSLVQGALGLASVALTFAVAAALGFQSQGPVWLAILLGGAAGAACVGAGMAVASLSGSAPRAFLLSSVAMFLLMLFSGVVFPLPTLTLFELHGRPIGPFSLLPTALAADALRRVLLLGHGLPQVWPELLALCALSALNFAAGAALWTRRHRLHRTKEAP
jgi:ABC-2 type transport system permease protein